MDILGRTLPFKAIMLHEFSSETNDSNRSCSVKISYRKIMIFSINASKTYEVHSLLDLSFQYPEYLISDLLQLFSENYSGHAVHLEEGKRTISFSLPFVKVSWAVISDRLAVFYFFNIYITKRGKCNFLWVPLIAFYPRKFEKTFPFPKNIFCK